MGAAPEGSGLQFLRTHTDQLYETADMMTLRLTDEAFRMTLSPFVPFVLAENIEGFLEKLLGPHEAANEETSGTRGIHPGGPKHRAPLRKLELRPEQSRASWSVLENTATAPRPPRCWCWRTSSAPTSRPEATTRVLMAFGPGLTMEGALVRF